MSVNFIVIGLTQPDFEPAMSKSPDLQKWETVALLIQPSCRVLFYNHVSVENSSSLPHQVPSGMILYGGECGGIIQSDLWKFNFGKLLKVA